METDIYILPDEFIFRIDATNILYWCKRKDERIYELDYWPHRDGFSPVGFSASDLKKFIFEDKLWVIVAESIQEMTEDSNLNALNII